MAWEEPTELVVEQIEIGPMQNYTYIIGSRESREVAIVDPAWDIDSLIKRLDEMDYKLTAILATHYHPDHVGGSFSGHNVEGVAELMAARAVKVYANKHEADGVKKVTEISESDLVRVDSGDTLNLGNIQVEFLHTPGHTPGSQCFRIKNTLVSGDTLFTNGCGRVDLPGSNSDDMFASMRKLSDLPDDTLLLPGHNYGHVPSATIAETKEMNPYLKMDDLETWRSIMG
jgi:hydroxyacylglutathione hydrolase